MKIVSDFFIAFCIAFNPSTVGTIVIREQMGKQIMKNMQGPAFKAITPNTIPADLFKNYVAKGSQFVLPPLDSLTLAAILGWYLYNWLKK